jgi:hypothetical protein
MTGFKPDKRMEVPPAIPPENSTRQADFFSRSVVAIIISAIGFWGALWYQSHFPGYVDSWLGIVFIFTLLLIVAAAIWASLAFRITHRPRFVSAALLLLVWFPILYFGPKISELLFYIAFDLVR